MVAVTLVSIDSFRGRLAIISVVWRRRGQIQSQVRITLCLLLWLGFFKTIKLLLSVRRDFSTWCREITLTRVKSNPVGRFSVMPCLIVTGKYLGKIRQTNRGGGGGLVHARYFDLTVLSFLSERGQVLIKKNNLETG